MTIAKFWVIRNPYVWDWFFYFPVLEKKKKMFSDEVWLSELREGKKIHAFDYIMFIQIHNHVFKNYETVNKVYFHRNPSIQKNWTLIKNVYYIDSSELQNFLS
jgi:hypothetical protein